MYVRRTLSRFAVALALLPIAGMNTVAAQTQSSSPPPSSTSEQHEHGPPPAGQDDQQPDMQMAREGSGTAWLPDITPMYAIHWQRGPWQFMAHENAFVQFLRESGDRGSDQFGSINWMMGRAQRNVGNGRIMFQGMFSAEPWAIRGCGYPDLLASGERCNGQTIQ